MFLNSQLTTCWTVQVINYGAFAHIVSAFQMVVGLTLFLYSIYMGATAFNNGNDGMWELCLYFVLGSAYLVAMGVLMAHAVIQRSMRSCRYWSFTGAASVIGSVIAQSVIWETQEIPFQLKALAEVCLVLNMFTVLIGVGYYKELSDEAENSLPTRLTKPISNGISLRFESQEYQVSPKA